MRTLDHPVFSGNRRARVSSGASAVVCMRAFFCFRVSPIARASPMREVGPSAAARCCLLLPACSLSLSLLPFRHCGPSSLRSPLLSLSLCFLYLYSPLAVLPSL